MSLIGAMLAAAVLMLVAVVLVKLWRQKPDYIEWDFVDDEHERNGEA